MKKPASRWLVRKYKRKKGDTDQLAAQLAPLEEQNKPAAEQQIGSHIESTNGQQEQSGAIVVDNANLNLPKGIIEGEQEKKVLGLEPVVLIVLIIMLIFIAFIAWQIWLMPAR